MEEVKIKELEEYFNYIKQVYIKLFEKILKKEIIEKISSINFSDIIFDYESDLDIKVNSKLEYRLEIKSFIKNNNLLEENYNDLSDVEQNHIKYIIENQDNVYKIVKETMLEYIILFFLPKKDILSYGMATYLANYFENKCHLKSLNIYYKEAMIIKKLIEILSEEIVFKSILNGDLDLLKRRYDRYVYDNGLELFDNIYKNMDNIFNDYFKSKNKLYYIDNLYNYSYLNYNEILQKLNLFNKKKDDMKSFITARINSIIECVNELERYIIILPEVDKNKLYYSKLNIKRIIETRKDSNLYIDEILKIEEELKPIVDYIWNCYVNYEGEYDPSSNYWFLIQNYNQRTNDKYQIMNLISNEHIKVSSKKNRYKYGFIYKIKTGAIVYSTPEKMIYDLIDEKNYSENNFTFKFKNSIFEIENQSYSKLFTPRNLLNKTIELDKEYNNVLVDTDYVIKSAVYCICKDENDINYEKAYEIANKYELPLVSLNEFNRVSR